MIFFIKYCKILSNGTVLKRCVVRGLSLKYHGLFVIYKFKCKTCKQVDKWVSLYKIWWGVDYKIYITGFVCNTNERLV